MSSSGPISHIQSSPWGTVATLCALSGLEANMHANEATVDCAAYALGADLGAAFAFALAFAPLGSEVDGAPASA